MLDAAKAKMDKAYQDFLNTPAYKAFIDASDEL